VQENGQQKDQEREQYLTQFECLEHTRTKMRAHMRKFNLTNLNQMSFEQAKMLANAVRPNCSKEHN
jgi:hypothetical protein